MLLEEPYDSGRCVDEGCCQDGKRGLADHDQQLKGMASDCGELVRLVADPAVVGDRYPASSADIGEPNLIRAIGREMVPMALHAQARFPQNLGKSKAEVSVGEEDNAQAARS
jgi:hypothetical protein